MKKSLLLSAALIAASSVYAAPGFQRVLPGNDTFSASKAVVPTVKRNVPTRADASMYFSYAGEPYSALALNNVTSKNTVFQGFELSADDAKAFAGNKNSKVTIVGGTNETTKQNPVSDVTIFITTNIAELGYTQEASLSTVAFGSNEIALETPYVITGDNPVFIGYYFNVPAAAHSFYIPIDGVPNTQNTMFLGVSDNGKLPAADTWMSVADSYGALCMGITLSGDNLPQNKANINTVEFPEYVSMTAGGELDMTIRNLAANEITSIEVTLSGEGFETSTQTISGLKVASSTVSDNITVSGIKAAKSAINNNLNVQITKVNGVACESNIVSQQIPCYDGGFERQIVLEDATGTWCGYCPGGIEMLDYAVKTYPGKFIPIGVHASNGNARDPMQITDYLKFVQDYISGFPTVLSNRTYQFTPTSNYESICQYVDALYNYYKDYKSYANVDLESDFTIEVVKDKEGKEIYKPNNVNFKATAEFALDGSSHQLCFVLIENNVGPYPQQNYFSNNSYGIKMNGWEKKGGSVKWTFSDVARAIKSYPGIGGSIPANFKAGEKYEYEVSIPVTNVAGTDIEAIAMIVNLQTGQIVNAKKVKCEMDLSGVESVAAGNGVSVKAGKGTIEVLGAQNVAIYNLAGVKVSSKASANLPAGIYMVVADGKTSKVVVR